MRRLYVCVTAAAAASARPRLEDDGEDAPQKNLAGRTAKVASPRERAGEQPRDLANVATDGREMVIGGRLRP